MPPTLAALRFCCCMALSAVQDREPYPSRQRALARRYASGLPLCARKHRADANDLRAALKQNSKAAKFFGTLNRVNRYAILYRVHKPDTRAARVAKLVAMLESGETIHARKGRR